MTNFAAYMSYRRQQFQTIITRFGLISLIIGVFSGCLQEKRPPGVLSPQELTKVMMELYLAEARANGLNIVRDSIVKYFKPAEQKLLAREGVSDSIMRITYQYYIERPEEFEKIYDSVIDSLSLREQKEKSKTSSN
ncbi:MAG: DUF4296 domain-containing protein [Cyclobacteriaceae bacterium]|nr:DUF4296 domain-containing protein [Cyclobacteriaceae bacterium]